jgi:hypothetical protein
MRQRGFTERQVGVMGPLLTTQHNAHRSALTAPMTTGAAVGLPANDPLDALKGIANLMQAMAPDQVDDAGTNQSGRPS